MINSILSNSLPKLPRWRFWLPLVLQIILIIGVPATAFQIHLTGRTVFLQTVPVDPYSPILGYSQTLSYEVGRMNTLESLPGWKDLPKESHNVHSLKQNSSFYVVLKAPDNAQGNSKNQPWQAVAVTGKPPTNLPDNQIFLKGKVKYNQAEYGLETYYMPEDRIREINQEFADVARIARTQNKLPPVVMEVKINNQGEGVPVSVWVSDRKYTF